MRTYRPVLLIHGHQHVYNRNLTMDSVYEGTRVLNTYGYRVIELAERRGPLAGRQRQPLKGRMKTIAVFGSSRRDENSPYWAEAHELGRVLATAGYAVLSGGYGGSMAPVSRGASEHGGHVIGVTCAIFDPWPCNTWLTEEVKAPTLMARLAVMIERSDAFVALRGGIGTLSESPSCGACCRRAS